MDPKINSKSLAESAWDKKAEDWVSRNEAMWNKGSRQKILPFFKKHINKTRKVLDVGCSGGYSTHCLDQMGYEVEGVDISREMIKFASLKYPHLDFSVGDISQLEAKNEMYDGVLCVNVIEFTQIPSNAIQEIHRILKKGGRACVGILGPTAAPRYNAFERLYGKPVIMNTIQPWEFQRLAEEIGFQMVEGLAVDKQWGIDTTHLPVMAQQTLSFMYVFLLEK